MSDAVHSVWLTASCSSRDSRWRSSAAASSRRLPDEPGVGDRRRRLVGDRPQPLGVGRREEPLGDALEHDEPDAAIAHLQRRAEHRAGGTERPRRLVDDHRLAWSPCSSSITVSELDRSAPPAPGRSAPGIAEPDPAAGDLELIVGADEDDGREVVGHQPLDTDEHLLHHLVGVERLRHRARRVAQRLGVGPLLAFLGLHTHAVVDLPAQALDRPLEVAGPLLHPLVEVLRACG